MSQEDWQKWVDKHIWKEDLPDMILTPPETYPCWILVDEPYDGRFYSWDFVYLNPNGQWDMSRYEKDAELMED